MANKVPEIYLERAKQFEKINVNYSLDKKVLKFKLFLYQGPRNLLVSASRQKLTKLSIILQSISSTISSADPKGLKV